MNFYHCQWRLARPDVVGWTVAGGIGDGSGGVARALVWLGDSPAMVSVYGQRWKKASPLLCSCTSGRRHSPPQRDGDG
jgi:hypothetical protein